MTDIHLIGIIVIFILVAGVLSARLWCYKKQILHMKEELDLLESEDTNQMLTSLGVIHATDDVIGIINRMVIRYREEENKLKRENRIYRESITSISHDIRTPLTSAKGYLQMMRKGELSEEKKSDYIKTIEQRLDHLTDMLNQLFEYARIEAGELKMEPEEFQAAHVFADTIAMFYEDFVKLGCEPEVRITDKACKLYADKQAYIRIIENLMKNALVHGMGGYQMSVDVEKNQCIIRVSNLTDTVDVRDIDQIFERFYTTDQSRTKKTTGLGLAIVKRFAKEMGGDARAALDGKRFTIEVVLPMRM